MLTLKLSFVGKPLFRQYFLITWKRDKNKFLQVLKVSGIRLNDDSGHLSLLNSCPQDSSLGINESLFFLT